MENFQTFFELLTAFDKNVINIYLQNRLCQLPFTQRSVTITFRSTQEQKLSLNSYTTQRAPLKRYIHFIQQTSTCKRVIFSSNKIYLYFTDIESMTPFLFPSIFYQYFIILAFSMQPSLSFNLNNAKRALSLTFSWTSYESARPWQAFPAQSNVCRSGQEPTLSDAPLG